MVVVVGVGRPGGFVLGGGTHADGGVWPGGVEPVHPLGGGDLDGVRACQGFCVSGLQVGCESVGVGGGELGQGLVPVGGDLSFDELALGFALGWWQSFLLVTFSGSFVLNVADRQPQQLDHRLIGGEVAAVLGDLAQLVVQRLDAVGGGGTSHEVGER